MYYFPEVDNIYHLIKTYVAFIIYVVLKFNFTFSDLKAYILHTYLMLGYCRLQSSFVIFRLLGVMRQIRCMTYKFIKNRIENYFKNKFCDVTNFKLHRNVTVYNLPVRWE